MNVWKLTTPPRWSQSQTFSLRWTCLSGKRSSPTGREKKSAKCKQIRKNYTWLWELKTRLLTSKKLSRRDGSLLMMSSWTCRSNTCTESVFLCTHNSSQLFCSFPPPLYFITGLHKSSFEWVTVQNNPPLSYTRPLAIAPQCEGTCFSPAPLKEFFFLIDCPS